jgi:hypothetical protein
MISMAFTKDVHIIGSINVRYSKWRKIARRNAATETKNIIHAGLVFFF